MVSSSSQQPEDTGTDIFVSTFSGKPTAFDLAVTGFQRQASLEEAGTQGGAYSAVKMSDLDTASLCQQQGLSFIPLVAETTGAWAPASAQVLKGIVRAAAAREQGDPAAFFAEFLQEASVWCDAFCFM